MSGRTAHGEMTLERAFTRSCNVTFGKLAYQLGADRLRGTAERFGFNENFKFGDFVVYNSLVSAESMRNMNGLVWAGIGQGEVLVTPLHMAMISGAVANGGADDAAVPGGGDPQTSAGTGAPQGRVRQVYRPRDERGNGADHRKIYV